MKEDSKKLSKLPLHSCGHCKKRAAHSSTLQLSTIDWCLFFTYQHYMQNTFSLTVFFPLLAIYKQVFLVKFDVWLDLSGIRKAPATSTALWYPVMVKDAIWFLICFNFVHSNETVHTKSLPARAGMLITIIKLHTDRRSHIQGFPTHWHS